MPKFTKEQVDQVFADAKHQFDYWVGLYKLAYGDDWERVEFVKKWPLVSKETNDYIWHKAIRFDQRHHLSVIGGGVWMNKGFSGSDEVTEWGEVVLGETRWKEAD